MRKKIFIASFLFLDVLFIIFIVSGLLKLRQVKKARHEAQQAMVSEEVGVTPSPLPEEVPEEMGEPPILKEPPSGFSLTSPVEKQYLESASLDTTNPQRLVFSLPSGIPIYSVFTGKVSKIFHIDNFPDEPPFEAILLERDDREFRVNYIILGEVFVKEGNVASQGAILAKVKEGKLGLLGGGNLSIWLFDKDDNMIKLSKGMFK